MEKEGKPKDLKNQIGGKEQRGGLDGTKKRAWPCNQKPGKNRGKTHDAGKDLEAKALLPKEGCPER